MEYLLPYLCMVTVPHIMVGLERMLDYRGVGLARYHCIECSWSLEKGRPTAHTDEVTKPSTQVSGSGYNITFT